VKLAEAQRLAEKLDRAERDFDASWSARWKALLFTVGGFGLPVAALFARFAAENSPEGVGPLVFFLLWGTLVGAFAALGPVFRRRVKRREGLETADAKVLRRCADIGEIPAAVAEPLERSLDAYTHISRLAGDPVWSGSGIQIQRSVEDAGRQLIGMLEWGKRLGEVRVTVDRLASRPEGAEVEAQFNRQLERLKAAAAAFQAAEAKVARAYVALSGAAPGQVVAPEELADLGAGFDALTEVLTVTEAPVIPVVKPEEAETTLRLGRSG
jgi:hypothetical protein